MADIRSSTEILWNQYSGELKGFVLSRVNDPALADDLLQETFLRLHLKSGTILNEEKTLSWLYQVARNLITDHFRKIRNAEVIADEAEATAEVPDTFIDCMSPLIEKLPVKYRNALKMTDLLNKSQHELASKEKISYTAAKSRVQRARKLLRKYITDCCDVVADRYGNIISHEPRGVCGCRV